MFYIATYQFYKKINYSSKTVIFIHNNTCFTEDFTIIYINVILFGIRTPSLQIAWALCDVERVMFFAHVGNECRSNIKTP